MQHSQSATEAPPRVYPLDPPAEDPRFTLGLTFDVARLLESHGYPAITSGADLLELQMALFRYLYAETPRGDS
ncbi:hypothetical protein UG55_1006205 [Frankia sp. EI5c]|uniref:hypothetical protein n=1 Tax=Frankia sp. EI5c TaxID=683316 RepID=UPI0007C321B2|nr:hypothetical protein [Frankia sp. EI5c]OAA28232.1 hypothetical protein UG55_1006205 [Frankia sp. EI5c]